MTIKKIIAASLLALTTAGGIACGNQIDCEHFNETTIVINQETNGVIDDPRGLIEAASIKDIPQSLVDLVNESHSQSSSPLPKDVYATFVEKECGQRSNGSALAYTIVNLDSDSSADTGVYLLNERIFPRDLAILYHEIGHLQECGVSEVGEAVAIINHLEQTAMSFGLLYGTQLNNESIVDQVGYARPFYEESTLELQSMILLQSKYSWGMISVLKSLVDYEGDFSLVRESLVKSRTTNEAGQLETTCQTLEEMGIEVRSDDKETYDLLLDNDSDISHLDQSMVVLRKIWPTLKAAYEKMANPIEAKFGKETAQAWREYALSLTFPEIELLKDYE